MKTRSVIMLGAAIAVGTVSITPPTVVAAGPSAPVMSAQTTAATAATPIVAKATSKTSTVDPVEARIKDLHSQLGITPAQEDLWGTVTQVMRENAATMDTLRQARTEKSHTMTAVEDFISYGEITEAHADGIKRFVPVFSALYDSMSDAQKKNADIRFRQVGTRKPMTSKSNVR